MSPQDFSFLLFWRRGESSTQGERTSEISQRCEVPPRGLVGKRPRQLQPWKALYRLLLHLGCELLARRRAVLREPWRNRSELFRVAKPPLRMLAPRTHRVWRWTLWWTDMRSGGVLCSKIFDTEGSKSWINCYIVNNSAWYFNTSCFSNSLSIP